jgi:hypothetical protein
MLFTTFHAKWKCSTSLYVKIAFDWFTPILSLVIVSSYEKLLKELIVSLLTDGEEKKVCGNLSMPPPAKIQTQGESWDE